MSTDKNGKTFGTAFNCMDGRCQSAVNMYVKQTFGVDFVDEITEPGMDGILAGKKKLGTQPDTILDWVRTKSEVSAKNHNSKVAVVVGHQQCAGNPVSDEEHSNDIRKAVEAVGAWGLFETVQGLMVSEDGGKWTVEPVA